MPSQPGLTGKGRGDAEAAAGDAEAAAEDAEDAAGTAAEAFFSEMPPWFHWKCILWAPKAELQNVSSKFWSDQAEWRRAWATLPLRGVGASGLALLLLVGFGNCNS